MKTTSWREVCDADLSSMTGQVRAEYDASAIEAELALDLAGKGLDSETRTWSAGPYSCRADGLVAP
jgi:hypothetical protein